MLGNKGKGRLEEAGEYHAGGLTATGGIIEAKVKPEVIAGEVNGAVENMEGMEATIDVENPMLATAGLLVNIARTSCGDARGIVKS